VVLRHALRSDQRRRVPLAVEPGLFKYNSPEYQQQAEELIALSASLTDRVYYRADARVEGTVAQRQPYSQAEVRLIQDSFESFLACIAVALRMVEMILVTSAEVLPSYHVLTQQQTCNFRLYTMAVP